MTDRGSSWVLTPCKGARVGELLEMLDSLAVDPERVVIVTTLPDPIKAQYLAGRANHLLTFEKPGMLFGQWLNYGFDYLAGIVDGPFEVLCIGSSLRGTPELVPSLRHALRWHSLTMCGPDISGGLPHLEVEKHQHDERTLYNRVPPVCFMVAGELGLRCDEQFRWWWSDDDLEMQARQLGEVALVGAGRVIMTAPDGHMLSVEQAVWAAEDRVKFAAKWGLDLASLWGG